MRRKYTNINQYEKEILQWKSEVSASQNSVLDNRKRTSYEVTPKS